jgi:bis(5'-nucleosyl)-tetraphosphatase (symmetrical)
MARYAIGDLQGCFSSLECLLARISFNPEHDELWFAGDLVNRGPDSLACLRFIKNLGSAARIVLGNHDLHLLAIHSSGKSPKKKDTLRQILDAPDCDELMLWLRQQPLMIWDADSDFVMVHAGVPSMWGIPEAFSLSQEVSAMLKSEHHAAFFSAMYGNYPDNWSNELTGMTRLRVITNYFTRMRFIRADGALDFSAKETLDSAPEDFIPWFQEARKDQTTVLFGHWAALTGVTNNAQFQALDTGCVWGGSLTAMNIDSGVRNSCQCKKNNL